MAVRPLTESDTGWSDAPASLAQSHDLELHRSLAGRVWLDRTAGTASKVYKPPFVVKLLYWLAFQAPFPYVRNMFALRAAEARRRIAGLLTRFWFGRDLVAPVLRIECDAEGCVYVSRLVEGGAPRDKKRARQFLSVVSRHFAEVGLPTWQVNPINPRSPDNLIETEDGTYRIIDLESAVVSPLLPLGQWFDALRAGSVPVFDDVFVSKTRNYVERHRPELTNELGEGDLLELRDAIDCYEECAARWRSAELRLWSRLLKAMIGASSAAARAFRLDRLIARAGAALGGARRGADRVDAWVREGIATMRSEGRLGADEAARVETSLATPETLSVLTHLGAHVAMSVPLRFPLGSIARALWTFGFRVKAEWRAIIRRDHGEEVKRGRRIHTIPVMLLAAVPGVGAGAYAAAAPLRENRPLVSVLLDQVTRKLPLRVYERLHLASLTCWIACTPPAARVRARGGLVALRRHLAALARHWIPISLILTFSVAAASLALGLDLARDDIGGTFDEFGLMQALLSLELLAAGVIGHLIFSRYWRLPGAQSRPDAPAVFFWLLAGWGLAWLAVDDFFGVHEAIGGWAAFAGLDLPLLNNVDDGIVLLYGATAAGLLYLFHGQLSRSYASFSLLTAGVASTAVMLTIDFFAPHGSTLATLENPANVAANAFILAAYLVKYRELSLGNGGLAGDGAVSIGEEAQHGKHRRQALRVTGLRLRIHRHQGRRWNARVPRPTDDHQGRPAARRTAHELHRRTRDTYQGRWRSAAELTREAARLAFQPTRRNVLHWMSWGLTLSIVLGLTFILMDGRVFGWERDGVRWAQALPYPNWLYWVVAEHFTDVESRVGVFVVAGAILGLWLIRWRVEAGLLLLTLPLHVLGNFPKAIVDRDRPSGAVDGIDGAGGVMSFPSGHSEFAVTFWGFLVYLALPHLRSRVLRVALVTGWLALVLAAGVGRMWRGAHWPLDVLAAYLVGVGLLSGLIWLHAAFSGARQASQGVAEDDGLLRFTSPSRRPPSTAEGALAVRRSAD